MGYRIHPSVLFTDLEDGTSVLLHLDSKFYYTLNETGTVIWRTLMEKEGAGSTELAQTLAASQFDVEENTLAEDIDTMFSEMVSEQILMEE